jgi:hypothetical protein
VVFLVYNALPLAEKMDELFVEKPLEEGINEGVKETIPHWYCLG